MEKRKRGRPRSDHPLTGAERQRRYRSKYELHTMAVSARSAALLAELRGITGMQTEGVVCAALALLLERWREAHGTRGGDGGRVTRASAKAPRRWPPLHHHLTTADENMSAGSSSERPHDSGRNKQRNRRGSRASEESRQAALDLHPTPPKGDDTDGPPGGAVEETVYETSFQGASGSSRQRGKTAD